MIGVCARCGSSFEGSDEDVNDPGDDFRGPECATCFRRRKSNGSPAPQVVLLRGSALDRQCVEVQKLRAAGRFDRWCIVHHHWLNDRPPAAAVLEQEVKMLASAKLPSRIEFEGSD